MAARRLEELPLPFQVNCKLSQKDYFDVVNRCKMEKISHGSLTRVALKAYLQRTNEVAPAP